MSNKSYDIQSEGLARYDKLQDINNDENEEFDNELNIKSSPDPTGTTDYNSQEYLSAQRKQLEQMNQLLNRMSYNDRMNNAVMEAGDVSEYFNASSKSRFDDRMTDYRQGLDAEYWRGENQSGLQQITSGLGKMAVIAATTAADSFIGTIAGIANVVSEAVQGNISKEHWASDVLNAGIENPVSRWLIGINDKAEEWMPNYYTEEEKNTPWYQQFWHANFIGDHFLKNTGFMLGAMLAGKATAGILSKVTKLSEARNLFKNTALAAGMEDKTAKEVLNMYKQGKIIGSEQKVSQALADAAKNARKAELELKLISSASGSFGESRMEAITNSNDWFEKTKNTLDQRRAEQIQNLDSEIMSEHPELFAQQPIVDEYGQIVGYQPVVADEQAYNGEYNRRMEAIEQKYNYALAQATRYRIDYSNASFGINFALTWGENFQLFGDALIGSYSKRSLFNRKVRQAAAKDAAGKVAWEANPLQYAKDITKGIASPIFEGTQEMWQQATTLGLNRRAGSKINDYYGDVIDKDGLDVGTNWLSNFVGALSSTYGDAEQWENFAMGFLTAIIPIPGIQKSTSTKTSREDIEQGNNKPSSKFVLGGEFWESMRNAKENRAEANALADALNDLEQDDKKKQMLFDIMRFDRSNKRQQDALDRGDEKAYKDEEALKLASMVMTYSDAGQIDYLKQLIDETYTVETPEQVDAIRRNTIYTQRQGDKDVELSVFDGMTDQEIIDYFGDQKLKMLDKVDKYNDLYKNMNQVYGDFGMGEDADLYRKQLAFDIMSIDDREERIKQVSGQLLESVKEYADKIRRTLPQDVEGYDEAIKLLTDINNLEIAFGEDGIIQRLEQKQHEFLSKRNQKFNELISEYDSLNEVLDAADKEGKEIDQEVYGTRDQINQRIKELTKSLNWVQGRRNMVANSRKDVDFYKNVKDLIELLTEREMLYISLQSLSGQNGKDLFDHLMSVDIMKTMRQYDDSENERIYQEYKKSGILDTFGRSIEEIVDVAKKNNDEQAVKELGQYAKYQNVFDTDTLDQDSPYVNEVKNNVLKILNDNKDLTVDEMDAAVQDYLDEQTDDEEINNIKNIISSRIKSIKQHEKDEQDAQKGVEHEDEDKSEGDDEVASKRKLKKFFASSEDELSEYLNGFDDAESFKNKLRQSGLYDIVDEALISNTGEGIGFDELGDDYNAIKDAILVARSNAYNNGEFEDLEDDSESTEEESEEEPEESATKKTEKKQSTPKQQGQPEARVEGDFVVSGSGSRVAFEDDSDNTSPDPNTIIVGETVGAQDIDEKTVLSRNKGKDKELVKEELNDGNSQDYVDKRRNNRRTDAWDVNRYGIWSTSGLKRNALERFEPSESDLKYQGNNISTVYSNLVRQAKCQEFIDNGLLDRVLKYFDRTDPSGKRKRIRFVAITDKSLIGDSYEAVNFVKSRIPLAAIELTKKDIENIIKEERDDKTRALLQKQFEDNTNLIQFNGQHGVKTFQVLGVVTPEGFNSSSGTYLEEKVDGTKYNKFKDAAFQEFITEFKKNIEQKPAGRVEYDINGGTRNFGYYKYSDFTSEVEYIYTGRLIKENSSKKADELVYLGDILTDSQLQNPEGHLQVTVLFDNNVDQNDPTDRTHLDFGRRLGGQVVPLNTNFFENTVRQEVGQTRKGTVWILTREADGNVYYKGCRVQSFNRAWYDENKGNPDNFYIKNIRRLLQNIAKNYSDIDEIKRNLNNLQNLIYLDDNHSIWVGKNGTFRVGKSTDNQIDLTEGTVDQVVDNMIETLFNSNPGGYRFALTSERLTLKQIIDSNILKTDLAQLHNTGASFAISKLSKQDTGDFESVPSETFKVVRQMGYRHTGTIGQDPSRNTVDLAIGDDTFTVRKEKGELEYYLNGKKVPKNRKNYYKALFEAYVKAFNDQDREKNSLFRFRGSGLYAYEFNASLNDDRTYGVVFSTNQDHKHYRLSQDEVMLLKKVKRQKNSLTKKEAEDLIKLFDRIGAKHYKWMDGEVGVKEGERKPSVDSEEQIEKHRKTLQERYGKDYPNIGDTISYRLAKIGKDGQIEFGNVITETITGYNKNSNIVTENGNTITKGELDLFYGVSRNMPTIGRNNGQYRHIVTKNNIQTQFTTDDKFDDVEKQKQEKPAETEPTRQSRRDRSQSQGTTQTVGGVSTQGNEDPTGVFNYGNRTLLQQKLSPFWMQHKNEIADIVRNSGKQGKFFDLIVQSSSKELKEELLAKIQDKAFNKEDANRLLDLIRDIIECK